MIDYLTFFTIVWFVCTHYIADFIFQTPWQAINKSKNNVALSLHVWSYSMLMGAFTLFYFMIMFPPGGTTAIILVAFSLSPIYLFLTHWITDYITSRITSKYFGSQNYHMGFVIVGLDQIIHYITIFLPLYFLTK